MLTIWTYLTVCVDVVVVVRNTMDMFQNTTEKNIHVIITCKMKVVRTYGFCTKGKKRTSFSIRKNVMVATTAENKSNQPVNNIVDITVIPFFVLIVSRKTLHFTYDIM